MRRTLLLILAVLALAVIATPARGEVKAGTITGITFNAGTINGTTINGVTITGSSSVSGAAITGGTINIGSGSFTVNSSGELTAQGDFYLGDTVVGSHIEGVGGFLYFPHIGANCGPSECYLKIDGNNSGRITVSLTEPEPIALQRQVEEMRAKLDEMRAELAELRAQLAAVR